MPDELWAKLLKRDAIKAGWHLTRADTRSDFLDDVLLVEAFAYNLEAEIDEIVRQLQAGEYVPRPRLRIGIPQSTYGVRPGSVLPLRDRVVLWSAIKLIAPRFDAALNEGVYSYRIKKNPTRSAIFEESDALDLPFLRKYDIQRYVDDFEPWYALWPKFEEKTFITVEEGYRFVATSDISAYFENISLQLLRDLLYQIIPEEQKIVNLLMAFLNSWAEKTEIGQIVNRGIPQGSNACSFFGNIFLIPVDRTFERLRQGRSALFQIHG
jgi:hypothetical protein